ncbi:MAG: ArsR/SmtB family transcription factor [Synechococcus sp.]
MTPAQATTDSVQVAIDAAMARSLFKALADPVRLQIIEVLATGERCVCELMTELGLAQSRLSFHLKVLKDCGLLADRQSGRWVYYRLRPEVIQGLQDWLGGLVLRSQTTARCCDD